MAKVQFTELRKKVGKKMAPLGGYWLTVAPNWNSLAALVTSIPQNKNVNMKICILHVALTKIRAIATVFVIIFFILILIKKMSNLQHIQFYEKLWCIHYNNSKKSEYSKNPH